MCEWVIERMVLDAGVDARFYSQTTDLLLCGGSVNGVVTENLQERIEIGAKVTIDTTGTVAALAAKAGVEHREVNIPELQETLASQNQLN